MKRGAPIQSIATVPSFAGMGVEGIEAVGKKATLATFSAGETVFREGEPAAGLHIVKDGWIRAFKTSENGREQVLRFAGPGESFNEIGAYAGGMNRASAQALEDSSLWIINRGSLLELIQSNPAFAEIITANLAKRVMHLMRMVEDLSLHSVTERLIRMLLEHSDGDLLQKRAWSTQNEMAARLGTVPDVLSRSLRELTEENLIQFDRKTLRILDRDALRRKIGESD